MNKDEMITELAVDILQEFTPCYSEADEDFLIDMITKKLKDFRKVDAGLKVVNESDYEKFMDKRENYKNVLQVQAAHIDWLNKQLEKDKREILEKVIDEIEDLAYREIKKDCICEKYFDMVLDLLDEELED